MDFWWKMSLAIVFSELTCINGDCSILGQKGGRGKLTIMFLESLLLNSSVTITLTSYCLVPNAKDEAKTHKKRAIKRGKKMQKRQVAAISVHKTPAWCL